MPEKQPLGRKPKTDPRAPFAEPSFYFGERSSQEALVLLVEHLLSKGAALTGNVVLSESADLDAVADPTWASIRRAEVSGVDAIREIAANPTLSVVGVRLSNVVTYAGGRDVEVRLLPISDHAVGRDRHPIAIWCDGEPFERYVPVRRTQRAAAELLQLFTSVVDRLEPDYGAILFAWPLPSPSEIAERPDGFEFQDFFLGRRYVGDTTIQLTAQTVGSACSQSLASGSLYLTSGVFGPVGPESTAHGPTIARLIVAASRRQWTS